MPGLSNRRFVVSSIQRRLLVGIGLYLTAIMLAFLAAAVAPLPFSLDDPTTSSQVRDERATALLALEQWIWVVAALLAAVCIVHAIVASNRIAGPLHRMKGVLGRLAEGDLSFRMQIRPSDYLWEEVEALNRMIAGLASRAQFIRESYRDVRESLSNLEEAVATGRESDIKVICGELQTRLDRLGERVNEIRTVGAPLVTGDSGEHRVPAAARQTARAAAPAMASEAASSAAHAGESRAVASEPEPAELSEPVGR